MMTVRVLFAVLVIGVVGAGAGFAAGVERRICVVDMERVMDSYPETREARSQLKQRVERYEQERKELVGQRTAMLEELKVIADESENKALSEKAQDEKRDEARKKQKELIDFEGKLKETLTAKQKDLQAEEETLVKAIVTKLEFVVSKYAEEKDLDLVLDSSAVKPNGVHVVTYSGKKVDITEDIIALVSGGAEKGDSGMDKPAKKDAGSDKAEKSEKADKAAKKESVPDKAEKKESSTGKK